MKSLEGGGRVIEYVCERDVTTFIYFTHDDHYEIRKF